MGFDPRGFCNLLNSLRSHIREATLLSSAIDRRRHEFVRARGEIFHDVASDARVVDSDRPAKTLTGTRPIDTIRGEIGQWSAVHITWTTEAKLQNAFESGFDPWGDVQVGDELPYIPEHQLRASAGLDAGQWRLNIAASYVGELRTRAGQGAFIPGESVDSHVVWDMIAAWQFTPQLSTYVKVDNLFDETYIAARRPAGVRPGLPRTAYLGLTYRL